MKKTRLLEIIREEIQNVLSEEDLNEMAKIKGDLKSSIEKVINDNPDLEGLALKEAVKDGEKDDIVKTVSSTPEEKKEKFNLGVRFIKKYKDDKPKVDAYLKKAKEEYKLPKSMLDDLKRTAGREVKV